MSKQDRITFFEKCGAIIGLIGGLFGILGGGLAIYDRFSKPDLKILGIAPVAVWERINININKETEQSIWGVSLIARVKNTGNKPSYILGANISGKIYLSYDEYWPISRRAKPNSIQAEIETQFNYLKPYRNISWVGWLADKQGLLRIDPGEERYVKVTFSDPILSKGVTMHDANQIEEIGYEKTDEKPKSINHNPAIQWFMKDSSLRDEFKKNLLLFEIALGNETKRIDQKIIGDLKVVTKAAWDEYTARKIYHDLK